VPLCGIDHVFKIANLTRYAGTILDTVSIERRTTGHINQEEAGEVEGQLESFSFGINRDIVKKLA